MVEPEVQSRLFNIRANVLPPSHPVGQEIFQPCFVSETVKFGQLILGGWNNHSDHKGEIKRLLP